MSSEASEWVVALAKSYGYISCRTRRAYAKEHVDDATTPHPGVGSCVEPAAANEARFGVAALDEVRQSRVPVCHRPRGAARSLLHGDAGGEGPDIIALPERGAGGDHPPTGRSGACVPQADRSDVGGVRDLGR